MTYSYSTLSCMDRHGVGQIDVLNVLYSGKVTLRASSREQLAGVQRRAVRLEGNDAACIAVHDGVVAGLTVHLK